MLQPCIAHQLNIHFAYVLYINHSKTYRMGIVKISDELHEEIRKASSVMVRSINSQAEFWIKIGRLAELNPTLSFTEIINSELIAGGCLKAEDRGKKND